MHGRLRFLHSGLLACGVWLAASWIAGGCSSGDAGKDLVDDGGLDDGGLDSPEVCPSVAELLAEVADEDFDGDTIPNGLDPDDDDDGVPDDLEHVRRSDDPDPGPPACWLRDSDYWRGSDGFDTDADADTLCDGLEETLGTNRTSQYSGPCRRLPDGLAIWLGFDPHLPCEAEQDVFGGPGAGTFGDRWFEIWPLQEYSYRTDPATFDISALAPARRSLLNIREHSPPFLGMAGLDLVVDFRPVSVSPGGGRVEGNAIMDLRAGAEVLVSITFEWPGAPPQPDPRCLYYVFWLKVRLQDESGTPVSDDLDVLLLMGFYTYDVVGNSIPLVPTETCGLFPECPPREW